MATAPAGPEGSDPPARFRVTLVMRLVLTFLALSVVMVGVLSWVTYQRARSTVESSEFGRLDAAQQLTADALQRWVDEQKRSVTFATGLLGGVERRGTLPQDRGAVQALFEPGRSPADRRAAARTMTSTLTYAVSQAADEQELLVLDLHGRVLVSTVASHVGRDESAQAFVSRGSSGTYVQPVSTTDLATDPAVIIATPLYDDSGRRRGVLAGVLDLGRLNETVLQQTSLGDGGRTYLVSGASQVLSTGLDSGQKETSPGIQRALAQGSGTASYDDFDGVPVIGAYEFVPALGAGLVSEIPQSVAFAPARRLAWSSATIGAVVVLLLGLLILLASRRIARPILAVTRAAEAVRGGDLTHRAPVTTRDEIGTLAVAFNDMTDQLRRHVAELEERVDERTAEVVTQKRYFETLVEISPAAVVTMDTELRVTGWNPAATRLFGYEPDEAIGRHVDDLVLTSDLMRQEGATVARQAMEHGRVEAVTRRGRKDGSLVDVEIVMVPLVVDSVHVGSYVVYHDVTELEAARLAADSANAAKSSFLAMMSHEIRTPLNAIIGLGGLLRDGDLAREEHGYAAAITDSGEALLTIINDILDFSKIEAGRLELDPRECDLADCLERAVDLVAPSAAAKGLELVLDVDARLPVSVVVDDTRLRQILLNLLSNAVKFTGSGRIAVTATTRGRPTPDQRVDLVLEVTDTGIGVTAEQQSRLFQSFSQADASTSRQYGGTGLGLAISRRLAELMGGTLDVSSPVADAHGTRFAAVLPVQVVTEAQLATEPAALAGLEVAVLVPDDLTHRVLVDRLAGCGAQVSTALDRADVVLVDETAEDALGHLTALPADRVVVISRFPRRTSTVAGPVVDTDTNWLVKPVKAAPLLSAVRRAAGLDDPGSRGAAASVSAVAAHPTAALRILLAEDNALNRTLALALLQRLGHVPDVVANGEEAVAAVRRTSYDVVLMDLQMPVMDGLEAARIITSDLAVESPWIVALTANVFDSDRRACREAGMHDFLGKPLRPDELAAALERAGAARSGSVAGASNGTGSDGTASGGVGLDRLRELTAGDEALARLLASEFVVGAAGLVDELEAARLEGSSREVRRLAHTLKSHAVLVDATRMQALSRTIEDLAEQEQLADVAGPIEELRVETIDVVGRVKDLIS